MKQIEKKSAQSVSVVISRTKNNVRIRDMNKVYKDILVQGEAMNQFLNELKLAANLMSDKPIGETIALVSASYTSSNWS
jgi:hypothetical protein